MTKLSIITINYNNSKGLKKTFDSIMSQTYNDFEYIVIDGGSSDGSKELIESYAQKFSYWISEPDKGIYNAMNKGIEKAKGEYILFINSGDELYSKDTLNTFYGHFCNYDLIYFDIIVRDINDEFLKSYPEKLSVSYLFADTLPHPATLIKKNLFNKVGLYDESLKIVSDWKFFITAVVKFNATYKYINQPFSIFYLDGVSSAMENRETLLNEKSLVLENDFGFIKSELNEFKELKKENLKLSARISNYMRSRKYKVLTSMKILNEL